MGGDLAGKAAIVTGGASGIGREIAPRLAAAGAAVLVADRDGEGAEAVAGEISASGGRALGWAVDVRDPAGCEALIAAAREAFGRLDALVTSAGIARSRPFLETSLELWQETLDVNLTGTFLCCQAAAPAMIATGSGRIITIASVSGQRGGTNRAAYGASKGGVITLTRVMAVELAQHNITVNAIAPGPIETPMATAMHTAANRAAWLGSVPAQRYGTPAEVAAAVVFLASDEASYITGHVLNVDGGFGAAGVMFEPEMIFEPEEAE
jgi:NAD(P)-dependent dehydrogenase (short-subunit alcohol dehydrogenase family)